MWFNMDATSFMDVVTEAYIGNELVNKWQWQMPEEMIMGRFMGLVQQVANAPQPIKLVMTRHEDGYDPYSGNIIPLEYKLEYWNKQETW